jgi:hypothetical protein
MDEDCEDIRFEVEEETAEKNFQTNQPTRCSALQPAGPQKGT